MKPLIAANWKMHKTTKEAVNFVSKFRFCKVRGVEVLICAPFTDLPDLCLAFSKCNIKLGAQNMHYKDKGALTGEISAPMLKPYVDYVILGHSERRGYETDLVVNKKVLSAMKHGIKPVMCVGENLAERRKKVHKRKVRRQVLEGLKGVKDVSKVVVAYEPIWAIGTGKSASVSDIGEMHGFIRSVLKGKYGKKADSVRVIYGGSVNLKNIKNIMGINDVNGVLVGGASLDALRFKKIIMSSEIKKIKLYSKD
jgi:triosephosphate isomerase